MELRLIIFSFAISVLILCGCDSQRVFEQNINIENRKWPKDDIKHFEFEITDIAQPYNIYYNIRNSVAFPFHNLFLTYSLEDSTGNKLISELQNMSLFDEKTGEPLGQGLGDIFDLQVLSVESYTFDQTGKYTFSVQQFMRRDTLPEILSIGIRVEQLQDE